jgi:hypothetical protein
MNILTNRNFSRCYYEAELMFSKSKDGEYDIAKMVNCCVDGICFETDNALPPGFDVCIKMVNSTPDIEYSPESHKILRGRVKWCQEIADTFRYGIGVQFCETLNQNPY